MQTLPIMNIEALAGRGLSEQQIADVLDIDLQQLRAENGIATYRAAIRRGRSKGVAEISNTLFKKAKSGDTRAMIFFLEQLTTIAGSTCERAYNKVTGKNNGN